MSAMALNSVVVNDWYPVARGDALAGGQPLLVRLLGEDVVLWRSGGQVMAWQDLCIHRGSRLSLGKVDGGHLVCAYHGWRYDAGGQCVKFPAHPEQTPPAKARAKTYHARERYGLIWVSLGVPDGELPSLPEVTGQSHRTILSGPFGPVRASAPRLVENFLDLPHLPFVHPGTLGDLERPEVNDYQVGLNADGVLATDIEVYEPDPYGTGQPGMVRYVFRVLRPAVAYLEKETDDGTRFCLMFAVTPHEQQASTVWFYMIVNANYALPEADITAFHAGILAQDIPVVESQRPELLPLDLEAELHLRSDRTAITYRKWLRELGVNFGTA
jgi:phenylpropionate dioxygenase-like ring-hydroxylating dioxygenase large terminal subunit